MFGFWFNAMMLGFEAQQVFFLRAMRLSMGGRRAEREASRMMSEKLIAAGQAAVAVSRGASADSIVSSYRRKVRANARRLKR